MPLLLAAVLSLPALPPPESLGSLSRLLKRLESPSSECGALVATWRDATAPDPKDKETKSSRMSYRLQGDRMLVTWRDDRTAWVWCRNGRHEF